MQIRSTLDPILRGTGVGLPVSFALTVFFSCIATGCSRNEEPTAAPGTPVAWERHGFTLDRAERQTLLAGSLLGREMADFAAITVGDDGSLHLTVHSHGEAGWSPTLETTLRPGTLAVDVAEIDGRDRLITCERDRLNWIDLNAATERELLAVEFAFDPLRENGIPHVDITRDVNADGRDDFVIPGAEGFWVIVQREGGEFAEPVMIGLPPDLAGILGAHGYRYDPWSQSRIHEIDHDSDGRVDLAFWNGDHFRVHVQGGRGLFAPEAQTFTVDVPFDSDDLFSLARGDRTGRVLHSLSDLNGDGAPDLVIFSLEAESPSEARSAFEVHLGTPDGTHGIAFGAEPDIAFRPEGRVQLGMERRDLDGDGWVDLVFTTVDAESLEGGPWDTFRGRMGDDIWLDFEFHRSDSGQFDRSADATWRFALDGAPSHTEPGWVPLATVLRGATHVSRQSDTLWPRAFNSLACVADVTGDGRCDLLIGKNTPNGLDFIPGVAGEGLFGAPQDVPVVVPNDEEWVWLADIDGDGTLDIVLHDPFTSRDIHGAPTEPPGAEPHRVTILLAR